ncbi:MAG TPA: sensor domain-containing diguanylate cyclase, partial [Idiomarina sp.]|nr:sensor domain-containing diguanylate cyclase [Idiomarina sp.]
MYFVGLLLAWLFSSWLAELATERLSQSLKDEAQEELLLAKSQLESALFRDVFLADSLATVFTIDPDEAFQNFESIAKQLMSKATFVRNVGVAPDDIIRKNYPLAGNEKAIGLDLKSLVDQYPTVLKARELKDVFLAGPLELVQGGRA